MSTLEVDPSMLDFQKSIVFRIILLTGLQDGSDLTFTTQPRSVALSNQRRRRSSCRPSCRPSCNVLEWPMFMDPQQRVKEMLEHPTNADTYLSFCYKQHPYRSGHPRLSDKSQDEYVLQTHSCILKIIQTGPMNRLLNTFVSDDENPCRHQSPDTAAVGHNEDTVGQDGMVSTCLEPIRDIRFEDVPPAAVEAVIRYIYLGSVPVLEPLCGYTVKDLMALATYLDIEVLKDVCVDMVLGRSRCEYDYGANHSVGGDRRSPTAATLWERPCYHPYRVDKKKSCTTSRHHLQTKCRVRLGSVVQVLFGWGFRFPKMRAALIRALVQEQGRRTTYGGDKHSTATDPIPAIDRFHGHEAYAQILCEMVAEQLRARGTS
ncbi:hypothetical protein EDD11_002571 [Mortierella claussenii]|nr:hypothetical protein EDD11_002571 [Mortierella claussenii]